MSFEELSNELKEQLKKCETKEAAESCLKENQIGLSLEEMEKASGGGWFSGCWPWDHNWEKTGQTKQAPEMSVKLNREIFTTHYEYRCTKCGETRWRSSFQEYIFSDS